MAPAAKTLHRATATLVLAFIVLHFATHIAGLWGIATYNEVQRLTRLIYQNPIIEPILLASVAIQLISGLILLIRKTKRGLRTHWDRAQVVSGGLILFFTTQHMISYTISRWIDGLNTNFYWPASVMRSAPFTLYFIPYYFIGVTALFLHIACALRLALRRTHNPVANTAFWTTTALGLTTATAINLMLLGTFYEITLPAEWITYLQRFVPGYDA